MVSGIIMASGLSKRMGGCKLLMKYNYKPMVQWGMEAVEKSNLSPKLVVTGNEDIKALGKELVLSVISNENGYLGQSQSIKLGVLNSKEADGYAFIPGDMPFITSEFLNELIEEFEKDKEKIIVPMCKERMGNPIIFPKKYEEEFFQLQGDVGGRELLNKYKKYIQYIEIKDDKFFKDIDTKEEYEKLTCEENSYC